MILVRCLVIAFLIVVPRSAFATTAPDLGELAYQQRLGAQIPLHGSFRDETGATVQLAGLMSGKPLIVALVYFHCPNICGVVRADLFSTLSASGMVPGRDYSLVALSIDPSEISEDAQAAKAADLQRYPVPGADRYWHFLTGSSDAVQAVADAIGFRNRFDPDLKQFIHPVGIVFTTPSGIVSSYLLGVGYQPADLRLNVTRAELGTIAAAAMPVLLLCFEYDSTTGRYSLAVIKLVRLAAVLTVLTIAAMLFLAFRRERRSR